MLAVEGELYPHNTTFRMALVDVRQARMNVELPGDDIQRILF